jgi:uridylate kinase
MPKKPVYRRVLLKMSGEALVGDQSYGIDPKILDGMAHDIAEVMRLGVQLGLVIGGGNLFRGKALSQVGLGRVSGDHMGMLATIMNAIAMRDALERASLPTRIMSAIPMSGVVDHYDRRKAIYHLNAGTVVICAAGTGNPLVTTDTAASLRAIEMEADILLKATHVDGVYTADPFLDSGARKYDVLDYDSVLEKELAVMDLAAFCQCRDYAMPIRIFNMKKRGILLDIVLGCSEGTLITGRKDRVNICST